MGADDHWWHIAAGRTILQQQEIRDHDQFSFTYRDASWVNSEWLYDVLLAYTFDTFGPAGVFVLRSGMVLLLLLFLYLAQRRVWRELFSDGAASSAAFLSSLFLLVIVQPRIADRPHFFAYLCIALFVYMAPLIMREKSPRAFVLAVVAMILWRNAHPSWIVGAALVGAAFADRICALLFIEKRSWERTDTILLMGVLLIAATGFLVSPHNFDPALYTSHLKQTGLIVEWDSFSAAFSVSPPFVGYLIFLPLAAWGGLVTIRRQPFTVLLAAIFLVQAFSQFRFMPEFALISHTVAVGAFKEMIASRCIDPSSWLRSRVFSLFLGSLLLFALVVNHFHLHRVFGIGVERTKNPVGAADMLEHYRIQGNLLANDLPPHAYMTFRLWPAVKIFIDGRVPPLYPESFLKEYRELDMRAAVERYPIDIILWQGPLFGQMPDRLFTALSDDFLLVYYDATSVLFARRELAERFVQMPVFRLLIPWRLVQPGYLENILASEDRARLFFEYEQLLRLSNDPVVGFIGKEIGYSPATLP